MGLDIVEIFMRAEEVFDISIDNADAEHANTVGKLYELICAQLSVPTSNTKPLGTAMPRALKPWPVPSPKPWTREEVWVTLVSLIVDQLRVAEDEVRYFATWDDLGAD